LRCTSAGRARVRDPQPGAASTGPHGYRWPAPRPGEPPRQAGSTGSWTLTASGARRRRFCSTRSGCLGSRDDGERRRTPIHTEIRGSCWSRIGPVCPSLAARSRRRPSRAGGPHQPGAGWADGLRGAGIDGTRCLPNHPRMHELRRARLHIRRSAQRLAKGRSCAPLTPPTQQVLPPRNSGAPTRTPRGSAES
jgi:hypothetical protein